MKEAFLFGVSGRPWNDDEISQWRSSVIAAGKVRDYQRDVVTRLQALPANTHTVETYGEHTVGDDHYNLMCVTVGDLNNGKPNILILGGVHGYEASGVMSAMEYAEKDAVSLSDKFNSIIYPDIVPWAYEYNQRWDENALDPNREVKLGGGCAEMQHFMQSMERKAAHFILAHDGHETSDLDIPLRQMRAERFNDTLAEDYKHIPQGYYLTLSKRDTEEADQAQLLFGSAIMDRVRKVSPVAPDDHILKNKNFGGIILSTEKPGLMRTYLGQYADYIAVSEVYPDHPDMSPIKSIQTQMESIRGALDFVRSI
jgi:hypothetical protein